MKEFLLQIFTWWNGATVGTRFYTRASASSWARTSSATSTIATLRPTRSIPNVGAERRWVIYNGPADASRVPPGWRGWLQHNFELPPSEEPPIRCGNGRGPTFPT
jgi:NADH:ubiquinone oxidoreductase subunit